MKIEIVIFMDKCEGSIRDIIKQTLEIEKECELPQDRILLRIHS